MIVLSGNGRTVEAVAEVTRMKSTTIACHKLLVMEGGSLGGVKRRPWDVATARRLLRYGERRERRLLLARRMGAIVRNDVKTLIDFIEKTLRKGYEKLAPSLIVEPVRVDLACKQHKFTRVPPTNR